MRSPPHTRSLPRKPSALTVGALLTRSARRLARARLSFGHGTDNPVDEAAALLFHALGLDHEDAPAVYARPVTAAERRRVEHLVERRIRERRPAAYLTRRMWFAGLEFYVDERVLVPRSPIAELIVASFQPWIEPARVKRVLDIGTGSGCIAIACACAFPRARIDASDISVPALAVTRRNIRRHRLVGRVMAIRADLFSGLHGRRYDIIVSNPPYVGARELKALPAEYLHEPAMALASGREGLDAASKILRGAARHLKPGGILVVEVGNTQRVLERRYPTVPFTWLEFERGGGGVFLLTREQLVVHAAALAAPLE
ncbi:MAG TPA: 50S ribosomal protein L3 N(5)-glutamine methyltransferase [Steroidobacteraceae bacterium]